MRIVRPDSVVDGSAVDIKELFKNKNYIPVYQRDYVWKEKQIAELWDDILNHYRKYASKNDDLLKPEGYFLGAMVVITHKHSTGNQDEIVDGQQRLTSLTSMASVLYEKIIQIEKSGFDIDNDSDEDPDESIEVWKNILVNILVESQSGIQFPKLQFSDSDIQEFFFNSTYKKRNKKSKEKYWSEAWCKERIQRKKSPFSRMRDSIKIGFKKIDDFLDEVTTEDKKRKRLLSFIHLFVEGVILLRITAMSYSNAYVIFESLNNRGIPLSQSDLIKNEILKRCTQEDLDTVADNWTTSRQTVESVDIQMISMPEFLQYSYISRNGYIKAKDIYETIKHQVNDSDAAKNYSNELLVDAHALEKLTVSHNSNWDDRTKRLLNDIKNVLNIKHCYPYMIAAYRKYSDDKKNLHSHVEAIVNFSFRFMKILEDPLEQFSQKVGTACVMINNGSSIEEIKKIFKEAAPDDRFSKDFEDSWFPNSKLSYFIIYHLEKALLNGTEPNLQGPDQNLEHILPQSLNLTNWPEATKLKEENKTTAREYLWKIGNLIPLPADLNKSAGNKSITTKLEIYNSDKHSLLSPKKIGQYLDTSGNWTYESIDKRQSDLSLLAPRAWPL